MGTTVEKLNKVLETKEAIRTAINSKGGTLTESDTFSSYSTAIDNIQTGSGEDTLKIYLTARGTARELFSGDISSNFSNINDNEMEKLLKSISFDYITDITAMFYGCKNITTIPLIDTSNVTRMGGMFQSCNNLITIPKLNTSNVTNMGDMFCNCFKLKIVPALDMSKVTYCDRMFSECSELEEIHITGMKVSFSISSSNKLTESALVEILNNLATVTSTQTLRMGSTNLAKLTDEEKAIATNKGWTLA